MWSLRTKLLIATILPILLLVPLLGLYLLSSLERFLTQQLLQQLTQQAQLLQTQVQQQPEVVENLQAAQRFLMGVANSTAARVMLLSSAGTILGSSRREDAGRIGTQFLTSSRWQNGWKRQRRHATGNSRRLSMSWCARSPACGQPRKRSCVAQWPTQRSAWIY
jgi:hypothetical protein